MANTGKDIAATGPDISAARDMSSKPLPPMGLTPKGSDMTSAKVAPASAATIKPVAVSAIVSTGKDIAAKGPGLSDAKGVIPKQQPPTGLRGDGLTPVKIVSVQPIPASATKAMAGKPAAAVDKSPASLVKLLKVRCSYISSIRVYHRE
jgi:hypothetical protein